MASIDKYLYDSDHNDWYRISTLGDIDNLSTELKNHNHDDRYNTKEDLQEVVDFVNLQMAEQYKVKISPNDEPSYLSNKLDNVTLTVEGSELKVKSVDGLTVGTTDISNWLSGTQENIQNQIDSIIANISSITSGMRYRGKLENYSELQQVGNNKNGDLSVVLFDETRNNARSLYVYNETLGSWDFVGAFEFSDEFLSLSDTPSTYAGANGKVLKVDEVNEKIIFSDIDYSDVKNKPTSTITQIDDTVSKSHSHSNKGLLDTYTQTNANIVDAVNKIHEHSNKSSLDKLGVNENGELTVNGVVYVPKIDIPQKQYLYARRGASDQTLQQGDTCIFNTSLRGNIPYNSSTGVFTLTANKTYRVTVTASMLTEGYVVLRLADTNNTQPHQNSAIWTDVTRTWREASAGNLEVVVTPLSTKDFKIYATSVSGTSSLRATHSALIVQEI